MCRSRCFRLFSLTFEKSPEDGQSPSPRLAGRVSAGAVRRPLMMRKYLAFDIETASTVDGDDWRSCRPLGITCAAALASDAKARPVLWHGMTEDGAPAERMSRREARHLVDDISAYAAQGYTLLTWNGAGFDFDVLAEEADAYPVCRILARDHVDMMFQVLCEKGFPIGIDNAAKAMGIAGKPEGMSGALAPTLWAEGDIQTVLDYVVQDVRMALQVAEQAEDARALRWVTRRGQTRTFDLPNGWLTVRQACALPEPDTSWMTTPLDRRAVTRWMTSDGEDQPQKQGQAFSG